jgi:anti-anti-sigma regulatory factor
MLKITIDETPTEQKWTLQGKLTGPWVPLLAAKWKLTRDSRQSRRCIVNLNDVTFVDKWGEKALRAMKREGAEMIACGVFARHVVESCEKRCNELASARRGKVHAN